MFDTSHYSTTQMAQNQEALLRYRTILKTINSRGKLSSKEIWTVCNNSGINVAYITIQKDLNDLRDDHTIFGKDLTLANDSNSKKWYCKEFPKELFSMLELESGEIDALIFHAKIVNQYKEYPIFKQISKAVDKVFESSNIPKRLKELFEKETWLETEKHSFLKGTELIMPILEALHDHKTLNVCYQKFDGDIIKEHEIAPVVLKEDKQMWYVIGNSIKHDSLITFALDRIASLDVTDSEFEKIEFNSDEYFKYAFGITVTSYEPEEVIISFTPNQGNYIRTLPIHSSQEVLIDDEKEFRIRIIVELTYEFYSKIKSYADQATIISPAGIAMEVKESFERAVLKYNQNK